ncbi:MAG: single-stranded DNA-binding protein [Promethearchaeota archaeon]
MSMDEEREETAEPSEEIMMSVSDLGPRSRKVNVKVKVVEMNEAREVTSRKDGSVNRVTEALVGDDTGVVFLTLWNDDIDRVSVDSALKISNGYCNVFKNSLRLNIGRYGSIEEIEEDITANTENNLSDRFFEQPPRFRRGGGRPRGGGYSRYGGGGGGGGGGYNRRRRY